MTKNSYINIAKARWQLISIMMLPIAVVLLATFVYYTRIGLPSGTKNAGELINPPLQINNIALRDDKGAAYIFKESPDIWTFLVVGSAQCDTACRTQMWEQRQTRTALGKYQNNIRRVWLLTSGAPDAETRAWLAREQADVQLLYADAGDWHRLLESSPAGKSSLSSTQPARFYLVDDRGFVMMYYTALDDYKDVITDLKFLLKGVQ